MKYRNFLFTALPAFALALSGCGEEGDCPESVGGNSIDGSYCAFADLEFDSVRVALFEQSNALDIRYGLGSGANFSTRFSVIATGNITFEAGRTIPGEFLTIRAVPSGGTQLGAVDIDPERSNLVLEGYGGIGSRASGDINLLIELRNASGGRAVTFDGTFEGTVVDGEAGGS